MESEKGMPRLRMIERHECRDWVHVGVCRAVDSYPTIGGTRGKVLADLSKHILVPDSCQHDGRIIGIAVFSPCTAVVRFREP